VIADLCNVLHFTLADIDTMDDDEILLWHDEALRLWRAGHGVA
jgi:hypothetical protein